VVREPGSECGVFANHEPGAGDHMLGEFHHLAVGALSIDVKADVIDFVACAPLEHDSVIGSCGFECFELASSGRSRSFERPLRKRSDSCQLRPVCCRITRSRSLSCPGCANEFPQLKTADGA